LFIRGLLSFGLASVLFGCHPQAAVPAMPGAPRPLEQEIVETAIRARVHELAPCVSDAEIIPGGHAARVAEIQLSIIESGRVQRVTVRNLDDVELNECIVRRMSEWMFPRGGLTATNVELRLQDRSAELAGLRIVPSTRTAESTTR
jgi:hypothetical protein